MTFSMWRMWKSRYSHNTVFGALGDYPMEYMFAIGKQKFYRQSCRRIGRVK
jgi:hypothetical protein